MKQTSAWFACIFFAAFNSPAQEPNPSQLAEIKRLLAEINYQQGAISIKNGLAQLNLSPNFRYLDPEDAETVLVKLWGNPPGRRKLLGMIVPAEGIERPDAWAVTIDFADDGYVKDDDAAKIDYAKLLKEMQEGTRQANKERVSKGYPTVELIGWAAPPHYDQQTHKMHWAKEIQFGDAPDHTLNYNIRILGRRGVLVLNAIAGIDQLDLIQSATPEILQMVEFNEGHRYADFDSKTDQVATYGLAALVAGGIATKMGLFKMIWVAIIAAKKFIIIGLIAVGSLVTKFLKGRKNRAIVNRFGERRDDAGT